MHCKLTVKLRYVQAPGMLVQTLDMSYYREVRIGREQQLPWEAMSSHIAQLWLWCGWQLLPELCGLHNLPFQVAHAPQIRPTISFLLAGRN